MSLPLRILLFVVATVFLPLLAVGAVVAAASDVDLDATLVAGAVLAAALPTGLTYLAIRVGLQLGYTEPLQRIAERARAVSAGHIAREPLDAGGSREVKEVTDAFNAMLSQVGEYVTELDRRRTDFRRALARVGDALASTHDRRTILDVLLETVVLTSGAETGVVYVPRGGGLLARIRVGDEGPMGDDDVRVARGAGLAGLVLRSAEGASSADLSDLDAGEPQRAPAMAVPLFNRERVFAVIGVYGRDTGEAFDVDDLGTLRSFVSQAEGAIENTLLHEEAARLSITDGLTGVWNRRHFEIRAAQEHERGRRFDEPFAVVLLDLDHFKSVNDTHGHQAGDAVLVELARRLQETTREVDLVARYGGEEFVLLLPKTDTGGASRVAEKIRAAIAASRFPTEAGPLDITTSIGVAAWPECGADVATVVGAADTALYAAKEGGRDRVELATPSPVRATPRRRSEESE